MARFLMLLCCITVVGCTQLPGRPIPGPEVPRPQDVLDFKTLYSQNCSACHGADGKSGPAYPLANPTYQGLVDDQILREVVEKGETGTLMPAFAASAGGSLTDPQIDALINGIRAAWKPETLTGAPPYRAVKQADATRGKQVYATYCASCHGEKSKAGSITEPAFLLLVSDQMLRTTVIAGRPDIGQPDWRNDVPGHAMTDQEVTDVVGWLSSQRKTTAGGSQ